MKCTLRTALTYHCYLTSLAKKKFLKGAALHAKDPNEMQRLSLLSENTESGKKEYLKFIKDNGIDALQVLQLFPSVELPIGLFFELMPKLQPRYYSIASSSQLYPDEIHICVAVVKQPLTNIHTTSITSINGDGNRDNEMKNGFFKGEIKKEILGICSNYLQSLQINSKCYIYVRTSTFHIPSDTSKPLIIIGPGTGVAPFIGFIQQRQGLQKKGKKLGDCIFYFGCRKHQEDFIYEKELMESEKLGIITKLRVAFSRDTETKIYVQHLLWEDREMIWKMLSNGAVIFVCGDAKAMAKDVDNMLVKIVMQMGEKPEKDASNYIDVLGKNNRYLKDVWAPSV